MSPMSSGDHKWLEDLIALARKRSFSKAALTRHVTQPQFSRRIRFEPGALIGWHRHWANAARLAMG